MGTEKTEQKVQLKEADLVVFEDPGEFPEYAAYKAPFTVVSSRFKDPDDKGRNEIFWEECATLKDADGRPLPKEISILSLLKAK